MKYPIRALDRLDALIAVLVGVGSLAMYTRTMAPDVLYGDSAELQTLAYTLGHTHSTGYPVYLFLARLVGFLPVNTPAWRVTFFSVLMAALAVAGIYLLSRMLTNSRGGACLASIWLALSYTLWSQAVITEVYAPGAAFLVWIFLLTLRWHQDPDRRAISLFAAALLAGLSLGMHATTALAALPSAVFVLAWLAYRRSSRIEWRRALAAGAGGAALGIVIWLAAFLYIDQNNPPTSFINVMLHPSRSIWGLTTEDMDTPLERISLTLNSVQWKDVLFEGGSEAAGQSVVEYLSGIAGREFSIWFLILVVGSWWGLFSRSTWAAGYLLASFGLVFFYVINYRPDDQYVFFLSTYIPLVAVAGMGLGALIETPSRLKYFVRRGWGQFVAIFMTLLLFAVFIQPLFEERLPALQSGVASFVRENYQFPVENLREPRLLAQIRMSPLPEDALVLMEWRDLYAVAYLAHVEGKKPGLLLVEAMPRGNDGKIADSLVDEIHQALADGRPVYAAQRFPGLEENFRLAASSNRYVEVLPKR